MDFIKDCPPGWLAHAREHTAGRPGSNWVEGCVVRHPKHPRTGIIVNHTVGPSKGGPFPGKTGVCTVIFSSDHGDPMMRVMFLKDLELAG